MIIFFALTASKRRAVTEVHERGDFGLAFFLSLGFWGIFKNDTFGGHFIEKVFGVVALLSVGFACFPIFLLGILGIVFGVGEGIGHHFNKRGKN